MNIKKSILLRTRVAFLCVSLFSLAIVVKVAYIQNITGDKWREKAKKASLRLRKVKATRGNIYSDNGSLLATSLPFYKLAMDPTRPDKEVFDKGLDSLSRLLSSFFGDHSSTVYKRKIKDARVSGREYLVLNSELINYQQKKIIENWPIFRIGRLKGGAIYEKTDKRFHPFSYLAYRTIGFINEDNKGAGLEFSFNNVIGGRDGEAIFRKMAGNNWKPIHDDTEIRPEQGLDIVTTIDINLQDVAEHSLNKHLQRHNADYGCVMLMEVATGEIKAIANLGEKPGHPGQYIEDYNYAVGSQGLRDPGSTIKLASMIALLEDSDIDPNDTINTGNGTFRFYDRILTDSKPGGYGTLTLYQAFEKSSNVAIARLINAHFGSNPQKYVDYLSKFYLDKPINFQIIGEAKPYIKKPTDKDWSGISLPWMSIGYEMQMSPLNILAFYNAVANNGKMIKPMIVKEVSKSDKVIKQFKTETLVDNICSEKTLQIVKDMLLGVVEEGTAKNIKNPDFKIAGKTGTARILKDGKYTQNYYTSFCGYFPAQKPKYSCFVAICNPKGFSQYGSDVSAPVFKEIADKIYARDAEMYQKIEKTNMGELPLARSGKASDMIYLCNELGISNHGNAEQEWVQADAINTSIVWRDKIVQEGKVPDVRGMLLKDALYLLENNGIKVNFSGSGRVITQSITPGSKAGRGSIIYLNLGS